jgi:hypothetical protein
VKELKFERHVVLIRAIFLVNLCAMHKSWSKIMQAWIGKEIAGNLNDI